MNDPRELTTFVLEDFGVTADTPSGSLPVLMHPESTAQLDDGSIIRTGPYAVAEAITVNGLGLVYGNDGDTINIERKDYTLLAVEPDGQGMVTLRLEEL